MGRWARKLCSPGLTALAFALGLTASYSREARAETGTSSAGVAQSDARPAAQGAAASDARAQARVLFDEAVELASAGNFQTACSKLEQSLELHDGLGTSFHLAGCWQKIGRTASAHAMFEQVANRARELGQTERERLARTRLEALTPKLSRVRIDLAERAPSTEVYRDDARVQASDWGKPVAVDRGSHVIRVTAPGKKPWTTQLDVNEPAIVMAVSVPALVDQPAPAAVPIAKSQPKKQPEAPVEPQPSGNGARTRAVILGGVGVAALTFGIFEGAQYLSSNREAEGICPSGVSCTEEEIAQHEQAVSDAKQARTWAFVGIGVGSAAVAVATYLFFSAPRRAAPADQKRAAALSVKPVLDGRGSWGASVNGSF